MELARRRPGSFVAHLAIWERPGEGQGPETEWGDLVTDAEYHAQPAPGRPSIRLAVMAGYSA